MQGLSLRSRWRHISSEQRNAKPLITMAISCSKTESRIGGLPSALKNITKIDLTISNSTDDNKDVFRNLESELNQIGSSIKVPPIGKKYSLGSASVVVVDTAANEPFKVDLIKMPHHGSKVIIRFIDILMPDYAVISAASSNLYGHPYTETLDMLEQAKVKLYRTDLCGDITVKSDGKRLSFTTEK